MANPPSACVPTFRSTIPTLRYGERNAMMPKRYWAASIGRYRTWLIRLDPAAAAFNAVLVLVAIGLAITDLTVLAGRYFLNNLPRTMHARLASPPAAPPGITTGPDMLP